MHDRFRERYENYINRGNEKGATNPEKHIGSNVAKVIVFFFCICVQAKDDTQALFLVFCVSVQEMTKNAVFNILVQ